MITSKYFVQIFFNLIFAVGISLIKSVLDLLSFCLLVFAEITYGHLDKHCVEYEIKARITRMTMAQYMSIATSKRSHVLMDCPMILKVHYNLRWILADKVCCSENDWLG
ncbi:hypothetical protein BCR41DRAFT_198653 [Lobosporangium transversale]|uniref:Uncharacterized protein n=1 Tax=Lobosporangium transversale TaxID=64571 RepID=A0A1Y2G8K2_9FUNG|nr:hypothetical protein BCR41DRAFT_198653 [Lobosporangium transversale]ORZ04292.1 hypothetical protein BCR41DRAFT_198653 [Lobosporangium transversale]|eukprot:XP_021876450.1 hypothetical protein BCR41DRAFT_198653 [Lobosporangium transversale]